MSNWVYRVVAVSITVVIACMLAALVAMTIAVVGSL